MLFFFTSECEEVNYLDKEVNGKGYYPVKCTIYFKEYNNNHFMLITSILFSTFQEQ